MWVFISNFGRYIKIVLIFALSVQFSRSVVSDSLRPHELHHARPPCPSPTPGVYSNSAGKYGQGDFFFISILLIILFIHSFSFGRAGSLLLLGLFSSCGKWGLLSSVQVSH